MKKLLLFVILLLPFTVHGKTLINNVSIIDHDNNGVISIGDEVCLGNECFYIFNTDNSELSLLSKYNLNVGGSFHNYSFTLYTNATNIQNSNMLGNNGEGVTPYSRFDMYSAEEQNYETSYAKEYVDNYVNIINNQFHFNITGRILDENDLIKLGCLRNDDSSSVSYLNCLNTKEWLYSTSYWVNIYYMDESAPGGVMGMKANSGIVDSYLHSHEGPYTYGVRPAIVINENDLYVEKKINYINNNKVEFISKINEAVPGDRVIVSLKIDKGYELAQLKIVDKNNDLINYRVLSNNKIVFIMPDSEVSIKVDLKNTIINPSTGTSIVLIMMIIIVISLISALIISKKRV